MRRACKCHGVSGSCSIQTCWMQLADFREVGNYLKGKYEHAKKLEMDKRPVRDGNSADNRGAIAQTFRSIPRTELIYLEDSPDYCVKNQSLEFHGTEGRECLKGDKSMSQWERKSCRRLCYECGLRVTEKRIDVVSSCNCKFHWCCTVKCDRCTQVVTKYYCSSKHGGKKTHNKTKHRQRGRSMSRRQWMDQSNRVELLFVWFGPNSDLLSIISWHFILSKFFILACELIFRRPVVSFVAFVFCEV